ncbi:PaaI family thioesterase [Bacillus dakarensis]|uniref:PaaI family thioesterase n=1 Tax=Robertmurraya dakarensis TaxID=1926278 RepID=UPI0009808EA7|nr:PaaI family thioesterase [Bacillus dakarensis]
MEKSIKVSQKARSPFNNFLGVKIERPEKGVVHCSLQIGPHHKNANDVVHGGVYFSILDTVMGATIKTVTNKSTVTINSSINFLAPLKEGDTLYATAKVVKVGKSIITAEGEIRDCKDTLLAITIGTFKVIRPNMK